MSDDEKTMEPQSLAASLFTLADRTISAPHTQNAVTRQLAFTALMLLTAAHEHISLTHINAIVQTLPDKPDEFRGEFWQKTSYCAYVLNLIKHRKSELTKQQWEDFGHALEFVCITWPELDNALRDHAIGHMHAISWRFGEEYNFEKLRLTIHQATAFEKGSREDITRNVCVFCADARTYLITRLTVKARTQNAEEKAGMYHALMRIEKLHADVLTHFELPVHADV